MAKKKSKASKSAPKRVQVRCKVGASWKTITTTKGTCANAVAVALSKTNDKCCIGGGGSKTRMRCYSKGKLSMVKGPGVRGRTPSSSSSRAIYGRIGYGSGE